MTVTIDQAMRGALRYADNEIIPHLPTGKGIAAGIALALIADGGKEQLLTLCKHPAIQLMQIMDDDGNVDIDRLYNAARPKLERGLTVSIPMIGDLKFDQSDADKLLRHIKEA